MRVATALIGWVCAALGLASCSSVFSQSEDMQPQHLQAQPRNPRPHHVTSTPAVLPTLQVTQCQLISHPVIFCLLNKDRVIRCVSAEEQRSPSPWPRGARLTAAHPGAEVDDAEERPAPAPSLPVTLGQQCTETLAVALAGAAEEDSFSPVPARTVVSEFPGDAEAVFQPSSHTATADSHGRPAGGDSNPTLEPSMDVRRLERLMALRRLSTEGFASSPSTHHRTQDDPGFNSSETCLSSARNEQDKAEASNRTVMRPRMDTIHPTYPQRLWSSGTLAGAGAGAANPTLVSHTSASPGPLTTAGQSEAAGAFASFLPQSEHEELREGEGNGEGRVGYPRKTHPRPEAGQEGAHAPSGIQLQTLQLGIPLCLLATLGMVLAAGLCYLHTQHCHKRTGVSFREPAGGAIARSDGGGAEHVRQLGENSCVLVDAEYNWITPSVDGKKTVLGEAVVSASRGPP